MSKIHTLLDLVRNNPSYIPWAIFCKLNKLPIIKIMPDAIYLKIAYIIAFGKRLNLDNPQTFNEKIQWLKLYDRNPKYPEYVDKFEVRKFVRDTIGEKYLVPIIGVYDSVAEIDFENLPNQFVLKCTHDSGSVILCRNNKTLNFEAKIFFNHFRFKGDPCK